MKINGIYLALFLNKKKSYAHYIQKTEIRKYRCYKEIK